jgi:hypothetical protein
MFRIPLMRSIALLALLSACSAPPPTPALKTPSAVSARALASSLLDAIQRRDLGTASGLLCSADRARVEAFGTVGGYTIDNVEAAWVGSEPYFRVDVTLDKDGAKDRRSLAIRARDGCVERTGGTPVGGAAPPEPGEISL